MRKLLWGASAAAFLCLVWLNAAPFSSHDGTLAVPPGSAGGQVVQRLAADGQLRSVLWFRFLLRATGTGRKLKAGVYPVEKGDSAWALARRLSAGRGVTVKVTVPEGWTADRIADRLESLGLCGRAAFLASVSSAAAEGFLFPDTYEFDPFTSPDRIRDAMTARFDGAWRGAVAASSAAATAATLSTASPRLDRVRLGSGEGRPARDWTCREVVTLASIIEREGGRGDERPLVAAVYHNRLRKGMRLEADPTVQYALGRWKERLLFKDLEVDSPYNTYRRAGLPPGPIGNPGVEALKAALSPAPAPYLYFVADEDGGHRFSATYAEHLKNVRDRNVKLHRRAS